MNQKSEQKTWRVGGFEFSNGQVARLHHYCVDVGAAHQLSLKEVWELAERGHYRRIEEKELFSEIGLYDDDQTGWGEFDVRRMLDVLCHRLVVAVDTMKELLELQERHEEETCIRATSEAFALLAKKPKAVVLVAEYLGDDRNSAAIVVSDHGEFLTMVNFMSGKDDRLIILEIMMKSRKSSEA